MLPHSEFFGCSCFAADAQHSQKLSVAHCAGASRRVWLEITRKLCGTRNQNRNAPTHSGKCLYSSSLLTRLALLNPGLCNLSVIRNRVFGRSRHKVIDPGTRKRCSLQWLSWPSLNSFLWQLTVFSEQAMFLLEFHADQELGLEMISLLRSSSGASRALSVQECHSAAISPFYFMYLHLCQR